jgi:hypothetical protein
MNQARSLWAFLLLVILGCGRTPLDPIGDAGGGGVLKGGSVVGTGGTGGTGGTETTGGTGGTQATTGGSPWGAPCSKDRDCREDAICCDGSRQSCDITRLPTGDKANSGELAYAADDQIVRDTITGLTWQRDVVSERPGCSGSYGACTWSEAQAYCASLTLGGLTEWRLPGRMELLTIVDYSKASPAADSKVFPMTPDNLDFWTSTPDNDNPGWTWGVSFAAGAPSSSDRTVYKKVRCVSGSRCLPKTRFAVLENQLVQDQLTGLVWQQVPSRTEMTWVDAGAYCPTVGQGFRLPTVRELESLVDLTPARKEPKIDTTAFPDLPGRAGAFWTSTPYVISPGAAWMVYLMGGVSIVEDTGNRFWVLCVR